MHEHEAEIDLPLVRRLVSSEFPHWGDLPVRPVASTGTSNALYRLGDEMVVRLPRVETATAEVHKEHQWLPRLAPRLPLAIPTPLAMGTPIEGYPWHWSIYRWIQGDNALVAPVSNPRGAARALAEFVQALRQIDSVGGPAPGTHNYFRGAALGSRDDATRDVIARSNDRLDVDAITAAWDAALHTPVWDAPPVWIHGDLLPGNMLVQDGRLCAVIDFGGLGVGDPACDMLGAWSFLARDIRDVFRASVSVDDATWARGRGWALSVALIALPYYEDTNPAFAAVASRMIDEVLADISR